jgi:hypothetical protein
VLRCSEVSQLIYAMDHGVCLSTRQECPLKHDASRRVAAVHKVDPPTGKISKRAKVPFRREPTCLEAAHLARRGRKAPRCLATDDPAHCRIVAQTFGVVHVLVTGETTKHRLTQQSDQRMATVSTGAGISEHLTGQCGQPEYVV